MAIFSLLLECTEQIIGTTNSSDIFIPANLATDFSNTKVNTTVMVALRVPCTIADRNTKAWSVDTIWLAQ
tara:strand:+ start:4864 stop:5073 length:210 start_codon:yes stop_codon:yes gene_type:complete